MGAWVTNELFKMYSWFKQENILNKGLKDEEDDNWIGYKSSKVIWYYEE